MEKEQKRQSEREREKGKKQQLSYTSSLVHEREGGGAEGRGPVK